MMPDAQIHSGNARPPRVLVIGGSLGGLSVGLALLRAGCDIEIFERSSARMEERGAGLVVQHETRAFMEDYTGASARSFSVCSRERLYLDRSGSIAHVMPGPQYMTSWNALYGLLKSAFPAERYHHDCELIRFEQTGDEVVAFFQSRQERGDLLVAADGTGSACRGQLYPDVAPQYAGYVAWRGVIAERELPGALREAFLERFAFFQGVDTQILCYTIPGPTGEVEVGERRLNWVWYWNVGEEDLREVLTDRNGRLWAHSVPKRLVRLDLVERQREKARYSLPGAFQQLVEVTEEPFIQPIVDLAVDRMTQGRVALLGDAAFTPRPHTAASTSKAITDAVLLSRALEIGQFQVPEALGMWEVTQLRLGHQLEAHGRRLGIHSNLGGTRRFTAAQRNLLR